MLANLESDIHLASPLSFWWLGKSLSAQRGAEMEFGDFCKIRGPVALNKIFRGFVHGGRSTFRKWHLVLFFQFAQARDKFVPGQNRSGRDRDVFLSFVPLHQLDLTPQAHERLR